MKPKIFVWIVLSLLALLLVLPFLIPMQAYRQQLEQIASTKLGVPVTVQSLHVALLPSPRANLGGVMVGEGGEVKVVDMAVIFDMATLFDEVKVVSSLEINQPVVKQSALSFMQNFKSTGESTVLVRRIVVNEAKLEWQELNLPMVNAEIVMSDAGKLQQAMLTTTDAKFTAKVLPKGDGYQAHINAQQWLSPFGVMFDALALDLEYMNQSLDVSNMKASLYGGNLNGLAHLDWNNNWQLTGKFGSQGIELREASKPFTKNVKVSGKISGDGSFNAQAEDAGALVKNMALKYRFNVTRGVLYGVDLAKAASLLVKQGQSGGETHFDELAGVLHTKGKLIELRPLRVSSGLLQAEGQVKVMPDKKLAGKIEVELKQSLSLVAVPLVISGTLDAPSVAPTKAALIGAVAGTAVLGPAGTALGVKAAGALDKLFGDK